MSADRCACYNDVSLRGKIASFLPDFTPGLRRAPIRASNDLWVEAILRLAVSLAAYGGDRPPAAATADVVIPWVGNGGGFSIWGTCGEWLYGQSLKPTTLHVWRWRDGRLERRADLTLELLLSVTWTHGDRCLFYDGTRDEHGLYTIGLLRPEKDELAQRWPLPEHWHCELMGASADGRLTAVCIGEDISNPPAEFDWDRKRLRVGLVGETSSDVAWVTDLQEAHRETEGKLRSIVPSNDGAFVGLAGWDCGVLMIDVARHDVMWASRPPQEVCTGYLAFSPDSKIMYSGGSEGAIYALNHRARSWSAVLSAFTMATPGAG